MTAKHPKATTLHSEIRELRTQVNPGATRILPGTNPILALAYARGIRLETLAREARALADRMTRLADRVEAGGLGARPNPLGEVGSFGQSIDKLCHEIGALDAAIAMCRDAAQDAKGG